MYEKPALLWVTNGSKPAAMLPFLGESGYATFNAFNVAEALQILRTHRVALTILENEVSCIKGELAAVRLKSAAPRIPILLICESVNPSPPQAMFVDAILPNSATAEEVLNYVRRLLKPAKVERTG